MPRPLRGIFRKRRKLLDHLFRISLDAGEKPVAAHDVDGCRRLAEYLLRTPFSLEKITWNGTTRKVICRSKRCGMDTRAGRPCPYSAGIENSLDCPEEPGPISKRIGPGRSHTAKFDGKAPDIAPDIGKFANTA